MEISLTAAQWGELKRIVVLGKRAEAALNLPVEISNGTSKIEIDTDRAATITISD